MSNELFADVWNIVVNAVSTCFSWFYALMPSNVIMYIVSLLVLTAVISLIIKPIFNIQPLSLGWASRALSHDISKHIALSPEADTVDTVSVENLGVVKSPHSKEGAIDVDFVEL